MGNRKIYKYTHCKATQPFYMLVTCEKNMHPCYECKNLLANNVTVKLYCSPTNYVISKVIYYKSGNANYMKLF